MKTNLISRMMAVASLVFVTMASTSVADPYIYYGGEIGIDCDGPELGPWAIQLLWSASTDVFGLPAAEIDEVGVWLSWEVPYGGEFESPSGGDEQIRYFQTGAGILDYENFEDHESFGPPYTVYADFGHYAWSQVNNWDPSDVVNTSDSTPSECNEL